MHKILLEKPNFDQIFSVSLEIFKKNWKEMFKGCFIFLLIISLLEVFNYSSRDYLLSNNTFQEANSAIMVVNIFVRVVTIYLSAIPFIGILYFVKDKLYESGEKSIKEYIEIAKSKAMIYMRTILIFTVSLIGIGLGTMVILLPFICNGEKVIAIFALVVFLLICICLIIRYSTYWLFWKATFVYQGMTGFDTLERSREIVSGNFWQIFLYNVIVLLIILTLNLVPILFLLSGYVILFYIINFVLAFINLFFIVFYSVYFLSFEAWHAQRTMRHDLKLTADGEHKG